MKFVAGTNPVKNIKKRRIGVIAGASLFLAV